MTSRRRALQVLAASAAAVAVCFFCAHYIASQIADRRSELARARGNTQAQMRRISQGINLSANLEPDAVMQWAKTGAPSVASSLPPIFLSNVFSEEPPEERTAMLTDPWGHPIRVMIVHLPERGYGHPDIYKVKIWSDGPNGRNELGNGDDVLFEYELAIP